MTHALSVFVEVEVCCHPNSEALFEKELCDLLVSLEVATPTYGKEIACILTEKASDNIIVKAENSLMSKRKKRGITRKAYATT
jgi:hypothetical protein